MNSPLVSTFKLFKKLQTGVNNLRVLDSTVHFDKRDPIKEYEQKHIPDAVFFDLLKCSDNSSPYYNMLPSEEQFAKYVGAAGIDNNTSVVVYDTYNGFTTAPRVWWMFRVFGHKKVSVLEGGLPKWEADGLPTSSDNVKVLKRKFESKFQSSLLATYQQVADGLNKEGFQLLDIRPPEWLDKSNYTPEEEWRSGCIPGSIHIPYTKFLEENGSQHKNKDDLLRIFHENNIDLSLPLTATCLRGIKACNVALAGALLGKEDVAVFDGSWQEFCDKTDNNNQRSGN